MGIIASTANGQSQVFGRARPSEARVCPLPSYRRRLTEKVRDPFFAPFSGISLCKPAPQRWDYFRIQLLTSPASFASYPNTEAICKLQPLHLADGNCNQEAPRGGWDAVTGPLRWRWFDLSGTRRHIYRRRGRGYVGIPKGFPKSVGRVGSRLHGFPCFPYSVISMACFSPGRCWIYSSIDQRNAPYSQEIARRDRRR
jgi:hypothetical protein